MKQMKNNNILMNCQVKSNSYASPTGSKFFCFVLFRNMLGINKKWDGIAKDHDRQEQMVVPFHTE